MNPIRRLPPRLPGGSPDSAGRRALLRAGLGGSAALALAPLAGCGSDEPALAVGDLPDRLKSLGQTAGIPGMLVRVQTGAGIYEGAIGVADRDTGAPMDMGLSYRVGSNTKPMVCHVVLQLVAEGRLGLDDPVSRHFTEPDLPFPFGDGITIRMLGNMTSGLRSYEEHPDFDAALSQGRYDWSTRQLIEMTFSVPTDAGSPNPAFTPGTDFRYANCNTVILGYIASRITGLPLEQLLQQRLFDPLGMRSSYVPLDAAFRAPHVRGYSRMLTADGALVDSTDVSPRWADAAGFVVGTHRDMARWLSALVRGDGLTDTLRSERRVGYENPSMPARYGFGHLRFGEWFGHNGLMPGYSSYHVANVRTGDVIGIACNVDHVSPDLSMEASNLVLAEVLDRLFPGTDDGFLALVLGR